MLTNTHITFGPKLSFASFFSLWEKEKRKYFYKETFQL